MLESGEGTEKDMKEAVALITKAAEAGMPEAQCYLGDMYYEGRGVAQDYTQAVALYKQALSQSQLSSRYQPSASPNATTTHGEVSRPTRKPPKLSAKPTTPTISLQH